MKLLWDFAADQPTAVAERWREKIRFVFVDEYQDINAAQDKIIQALSRDGWGEIPASREANNADGPLPPKAAGARELRATVFSSAT